jgi:phosphatidylglycerophosphate synthase
VRALYSIARVLARIRVKPGTVTFAGLLLSLLAPVFAALHHFWPVAAAAAVLLSAVADGLDGALAVVTDKVSRLGYVYDALADRIGELAWLVALFLLGVPAWLVVTCGALTWLHEYVHARAIGAGVRRIDVLTLGERPMRVGLASLALLLAGLAGSARGNLAAGAATGFVAVWTLLGAVGLAQVVGAVHHTLTTQQVRVTPPPEPVREEWPL